MLKDIKTRELKIPKLFKLSMSVYGKYFALICLICLAVYVPLYTIFSLLPIQRYMDIEAILAGDTSKFMEMGYFIIGISIIFTPLAAAAFTYIGTQAIAEEKITLAGILDASLMKWPKLTLTALFFIVVIFVSSTLIIPAIYFAISLGFYNNVVAMTDKWGFAAIWESRNVVKGRWWRTAFFMILINLLTLIVGSVVELAYIGKGGSLGIVLSIMGGTFSKIVTGYFQMVVVMYFLNLFHNAT